jgi:hypothetical protein
MTVLDRLGRSNALFAQAQSERLEQALQHIASHQQNSNKKDANREMLCQVRLKAKPRKH